MLSKFRSKKAPKLWTIRLYENIVGAILVIIVIVVIISQFDPHFIIRHLSDDICFGW